MTRLRPERAPLGAGYWRLWTSSGISNLADGMAKVALPLVAIQYTRSPALIAGLMVAMSLPWLGFALYAGAFADRLDRRVAMLGANMTRAALLGGLVLAAVLDGGSIWLLYVVAVGLGVAETLYDTSAQSLIPQLVRPGQLSRANGRLYAVELTANEFAGPPLAGGLVAVGAVVAFTAPAALWGVAVVVLVFLRGRFRAERDRTTSLHADIGEGLRYLWRHRLLRTFAVMVGGFNFASDAMLAILVLYAVGPSSAMGLSESGYGVLLAMFAVGSIVGSLVAEWVERALGRARSLVLSTIAGAVAMAVPAVTANVYLVGAAFVVSGVGVIVYNLIVVSLRQRITPNRLLGRLTSSHRLVAWGSRPIGAAAGGVLAELAGFRAVFALTAVMVLALLGCMVVITDERMDAAEREVRRE